MDDKHKSPQKNTCSRYGRIYQSPALSSVPCHGGQEYHHLKSGYYKHNKNATLASTTLIAQKEISN